ncbi:MAG: 50S ribosomal protein L23 [Acetothermia bacterium 64_32]|nr:MAG: 50S ribosomal protein L23 [Acetothermia bacterium 64_32]MBC7097760.1 50S ribosomal protein L23 [Candidatus Bipolaricaulota bacterium]HAF70233.1 50S ribosomal protein L23 [Candidatus Acetothermia bacterium]
MFDAGLHPEDVLLRPILTEKSWREMEEGKYTFEVHPRATKVDIRRAVEELFGVKVLAVRTLARPGKPRRTRMDRGFGRTKAEKRAIVKLAPGHKIDIVG